jgi:hypothetical protein
VRSARPVGRAGDDPATASDTADPRTVSLSAVGSRWSDVDLDALLEGAVS